MSLMTRRVAPTEQGQLQGANSSLMGIASMIGPALFTLIYARAISPVHGFASSGRAVRSRCGGPGGGLARRRAGDAAARGLTRRLEGEKFARVQIVELAELCHVRAAQRNDRLRDLLGLFDRRQVEPRHRGREHAGADRARD